jgi:hypothetical protein
VSASTLRARFPPTRPRWHRADALAAPLPRRPAPFRWIASGNPAGQSKPPRGDKRAQVWEGNVQGPAAFAVGPDGAPCGCSLGLPLRPSLPLLSSEPPGGRCTVARMRVTASRVAFIFPAYFVVWSRGGGGLAVVVVGALPLC